MARKQEKQTHPLLNPVFGFFIILTALITNLRYPPALDKELEIRVLGLAVFMFVIVLVSVFNKKNRLNIIHAGVLKNPFVLLYFLYLIITGISVFRAHNTGEALHEFLKLFTYFTLFLYVTLYVLPKKNSREMFLKAVIVFSVIIAIVGTIQALRVFPEHGFSVKSAYLIKGNFAHKNMFSQILFLAFSFAVYGIYYFKNHWRTAAVFGAAFNLLLIVALMTRSVWVAMVVSTALTFLAYQFFFRKKVEGRLLPKPVIYALSGIIIAAAAAFFLFARLDPDSSIKKHITEATDFTSGNTYHRLNIWKKSIPIVKEHPVLGVGAGNWKIEVSKYNVALYYNDRGWVVPRRTHNDYINVVTETGLLGLLVFLSMFGVLLFYLIKNIKRAENRNDKLFAIILFFALIGYMTFSFFSFTKERTESQILLNLIFAFIIYEYTRIKNPDGTRSLNNSKVRTVAAIALLPLFFTAYSAQQRLKVEEAVHKVYAYSKANSKQAVQLSYSLVKDLRSPFISLSPMNDPLYSLQGINMLKLKMNIHEIAKVYEKALDDFPFHVKTLNEAAYVQSLAGNDSLALRYSAQAFEYAPDNRKVHLDHVVYLEKAGKSDEAFEVLTQIDPNVRQKRYRTMLYAFLKKKLFRLAQESKNRLLAKEIERLAKNSNLVHKLYIGSRKNEKSFEEVFLKRVMRDFKKKHPEAIDSIPKAYFKKYNVNV
jgi:O-antigen ligase